MVSGKGWTLLLAHSLSWEAELRNGFQTGKVSPTASKRKEPERRRRREENVEENKKAGGRRRGRKG